MSLVSSLNVGVSSLRTYSEGIQTVSNNIANVNTVGYKASHAQYSDTFSNILKPLVPNERNTAVKIAPTQVGGGVQIEAISPVFSQGTIQVTNSNSDLAIAGNGFFRVKDALSTQSYVTRAGNFRVDADGYLVTQQGFNVQGAVGARTKVVYDTKTGGYDVKGPQDNPLVTIPAGMTQITTTGITAVANSKIITMPNANGLNLSEGMVIGSSSGGEIATGATITKITRDATTTSVTLSRAAFASAAGTVSIVTGGLTVSSKSNLLTFPPDASRPAVTVGTPITGPGLPPGTVIQAASGNIITSIDAAPSPVTLPQIVYVTPTSFKVSMANVTAAQMSSLKGMVLSGNSVIPANTEVTGFTTNGSDYVINLSKSLTADPGMVDLNAQANKTIDKSQSYIRVKDKTGLLDGMTVSGDGIPVDAAMGPVVIKASGVASTPLNDGTYQIDLVYKNSGLPVQLTGDSYSASKWAFGDQQVSLSNLPLVDAYETTSFRLGTEYKSADDVGNLKVSFDWGSDFDFYGTDGNLLTGISLEAAKASAPKIRTFNIGTDGGVNVILSNGQTYRSGSVLIQSFKDPGALTREGDNLFSGIETAGPYNGEWSKENITNLTPSNKGLGSINGGSLELSNVDIGEEFATLITTQRAFQAGSRIVTTADQMLEEAVNLKR